MKIRFVALAAAILVSAAALAGVGAYLKYDVIRPLGLTDYADKSIFELPFLACTDEVLKFMLENAEDMNMPPQSSAPSTSMSTSPSTSSPGTEPAPTETTTPTEPSETTAPTEPAAPVETRPANPNFNFPGPLMGDSWFDNTLFIGNSLTVGLRTAARSGSADYFCDQSMSVYNLNSRVLSDDGFSNMTLEQLLASKTYDKIFINLGINETGYPTRSFELAYQQIYEQIRAAQPDAVIVLQGIMSVTRKKAAEGDYFAPGHIASRNELIASFANGVDTFYADVNVFFTDAEGYLLESMTHDGCHLTGTACADWRDWIAYIAGTLPV